MTGFDIFAVYFMIGAAFLYWSTSLPGYSVYIEKWRQENKLSRFEEVATFTLAYLIIVICWFPLLCYYYVKGVE